MSALATLDDLKEMLGSTSTDSDTLLTKLLERASAIFETEARALDGGMRRSADEVEFPKDSIGSSQRVTLARWPIESVSEVVQLASIGTDADFDAEVVAGGALVENEDFYVDADMGVLVRINNAWSLGPRHLRVTYTAGWVDPSDGSPPSGSIQPPTNVQEAVLLQAIRLWQTKDTAGYREIDLGQGGGRVSLAETKPHPAIVSAAAKWRRVI